MRRSAIAAVAVIAVLAATVLQGALAPPVSAARPVSPAPPVPARCQHGLLTNSAPRVQATCAAVGTSGGTVAPLVSSLPAAFQETTAWSGLTNPTAIRFAADGRVFIAEKSGVIKAFDNLSDQTPTVFSSLVPLVHNYWDRGLLGLALDPSMTGGSGAGSFVYVLYSYDHVLGTTTAAPRWGDACPTPPGPTTDGCAISARLSKFALTGTTITDSQEVLVEDWCQQFPGHSIGSLVFGPDGALYASGGDGANFNAADWGQFGGTSGTPPVTPRNPCGDPPGGSMSAPSAEGGSLRAQDVRTAGTVSNPDPTALNGAIIRIDPVTGAGMAGNPFAASTDPNAQRIIAYGLRNPFRITPRPGTNELWVGDVGWATWEEIDRIPNMTDNVAENFGWPCYEGAARQPAFDSANLTLCESLYTQGTAGVQAPFHAYRQSAQVVPGETCPTGGSSIAGIAFYPESGGSFPAAYAGGLFFADHTRNCIWFMPKGTNGDPDPTAIRTFVAAAANPVDLVIGPGGDLFYPDFDGGTIRRISPTGGNQPPTAAIQATPPSGPAPLTVQFNGSGSSDPEGTPLAFAWDLDGDGQYDDATDVAPSWTYPTPGNVTVGLKVTDAGLATGTTTKVISVGNSPPKPVILGPSSSLKWKVGDPISFSGSATDAEDGTLPASSLSWTLVVQHCPSNCHAHTIQSWPGVASGSFNAPDHGYPSYLELTLKATDSLGTTSSSTVRLDPTTVVLTFRSAPAGLSLAVNSSASTTPFTRTVIVGSANSVTATSPQTLGGLSYAFSSWSDGGIRSHTIVAPSAPATYTGNFGTSMRSFTATADSLIRQSSATTNFGKDAVLRVRSGLYRTYLKFVVTGLSARPASAKVRLFVTESSTSGGTAFSVSNSWSETGIMWSKAPAISGTSLSTVGAAAKGKWVEFSVSPVITGNGTYSIAITRGNTDSVDYASRETTNAPVLIVTP